MSAEPHHSSPQAFARLSIGHKGKLHIEPSPIHYRILTKHGAPVSEAILMESKSAFLVWEVDISPSPKLAFRNQDVAFASNDKEKGLRIHSGKTSLSSSNMPSQLAKQFFDLYLSADDGREPYSQFCAWAFAPETPLTESTNKDCPSPDQLIVLQADKFPDIWEEHLRMIGNVRNPYHRVDALPSFRKVQVLVRSQDGEQKYILADTKDVEPNEHVFAVFETGLPTRWYLPLSAFKAGLQCDVRITPPPGAQTSDFPSNGLVTVCPYKGYARYHTIHLPNGEELKDIAWSYPEAIPALDLRGTIALPTPGNNRFILLVDEQEVM